MPNLKESAIGLLESMDELCGAMIEEAEEMYSEANESRATEIGDLRAVIRGLINSAYDSSPEKLNADMAKVDRRFRGLQKSRPSAEKKEELIRQILQKGRKG
jgi:hypothetical protein